MIQDLFFELIRVTIGTQDRLSRPPSGEEWKLLYDMAKKQSLVGVCFAAVQRLSGIEDSINHKPYTINLPEVLYLTWMGMAAKIQQRNQVVDEQCVDLQKRLSAEGFKCCILKGQGVGQQYAEHLRSLRQSGDIDVLVDAPLKRIMEFINKTSPTNEVDGHHVHYDIFPDTEVELHYVAANLPNPFSNRKLQRFLKSEWDNTRKIKLLDGEIVVPSMEFQLVHLMVHTFHHFFTEGVGMRQLMDYYFVLKSLNNNHDNDTANTYDDDNVLRIISDLGLERFTAGVMNIMQTVFGLDEKMLLCEADPEAGAMILSEVMARGNFGNMSEDNVLEKNLAGRSWQKFWFAWRYRRLSPWFWFWNPIYTIRKSFWKKINNYK